MKIIRNDSQPELTGSTVGDSQLDSKGLEELYRGKSVIIMGPASCVLDDVKLLDRSVDDYDLIVRLNQRETPLAEFPELGTRSDVVYTCATKHDLKAADFNYIKDNGVKLIITNKKQFRTFLNVNKKYNCNYFLIDELWKSMSKKVGSHINTGALAIQHVLSSPVDSVTIVGFDFYSEGSHYFHTQYEWESQAQVNKNILKYHNNQNKQKNLIMELSKKDDRLIIVGKCREVIYEDH